MEKNNEFWGLEPAVTAIEWIPVSDRVLAFQNGEIDITVIPVDLLKNFENNKEFKIVKNFGLHNYRFYFIFVLLTAFQDIVVRQDIAFAIDRKDFIDKLESCSVFL